MAGGRRCPEDPVGGQRPGLCQAVATFLPELMEVLERHGELVLEQEVKDQISSMSPATIDRLLRPHRQGELRRPFSTTKPGTLLKAAIPIRTFAKWNEDRPGFLE